MPSQLKLFIVQTVPVTLLRGVRARKTTTKVDLVQTPTVYLRQVLRVNNFTKLQKFYSTINRKIRKFIYYTLIEFLQKNSGRIIHVIARHKNSYGVFTTSKIIRDYFLSRWGLNKLRLLISFLVRCTLLRDSIEKKIDLWEDLKKRDLLKVERDLLRVRSQRENSRVL